MANRRIHMPRLLVRESPLNPANDEHSKVHKTPGKWNREEGGGPRLLFRFVNISQTPLHTSVCFAKRVACRKVLVKRFALPRVFLLASYLFIHADFRVAHF